MLSNQSQLFDLSKEVVYLNCAYMSPQLKALEHIGKAQIEKKNRPWLLPPSDFFEPVTKLKKNFAQLIQEEDHNRIAIIAAASYGIASVVKNIPLKVGQKVILMEEQFPSNYYAWARACDTVGAYIETIKAPDSLNRGEVWNERILEAIDEYTAVITMGHVHWADGSLFDLEAIRKKADEVGAYLIIDGTQSIGALDFNVQKIKPDALVCGGYKWLLGPYSLGIAYFGPRFDQGIPLEESWLNRHNSEDFAGLVNYEANYKPLASRYSVGEHSNFFLVPQLTESIRQLIEWGTDNIQEYCYEITKKGMEVLKEIGCRIDNGKKQAYHIQGIRFSDNIDAQKLEENLQANKVNVSKRGNAIRVSPHVYNSEEEFLTLVDCFKGALKQQTFALKS